MYCGLGRHVGASEPLLQHLSVARQILGHRPHHTLLLLLHVGWGTAMFMADYPSAYVYLPVISTSMQALLLGESFIPHLPVDTFHRLGTFSGVAVVMFVFTICMLAQDPRGRRVSYGMIVASSTLMLLAMSVSGER